MYFYKILDHKYCVGTCLERKCRAKIQNYTRKFFLTVGQNNYGNKIPFPFPKA